MSGGVKADLVVTFTGRRDGTLFWEQLDILDPFLPWGATPLAANVFFGTQVVDYSSYSDTWGRAIIDPDLRWGLLNLQDTIFAALAQRYKGRVFHAYIEHEAALDKIVEDTGVLAGYEAFLIQSVRDLRSRKPGCSILWSPAFFRATPTAGTAAVLQGMFERVATLGGGGGIDWILLQDMGGRGWLKPTAGDVKAWMAALGTSFRSKQVNVEQFKTVNGQLLPGDPDVLKVREAAYRTAGLDIGASWEMRWYMRQSPQIVSQPAPAPQAPAPTPVPTDTLVAVTGSYVGASWPRLAANNTWTSNRAEVATWLRDGTIGGKYARRAVVADNLGLRLHNITGLAVQGRRYMRPYTTNPTTGRAVNSDHLTAGAIDIFLKTDAEKAWLPYLYETMRILQERHVVRYIVRLGANAAHWDHIHVSLQLGVRP